MKKIIKIFLIVLWMMFIFHLSHQPASVSAGQSGGLINMLINMPVIGNVVSPILTSSIGEFVIRKSAHMFLYFILAILTFKLVYRKEKDFNNKIIIKKLLISLAIVFLYACTDEFHQLFIPGRSGEFRDIMVDTAGGCIGLCIMWIYTKMRYAEKQSNM